MSIRAKGDKADRIIALLSPSCADFLITLFAALRLGYGVLLLAPQNTTEAITHLCRAASASHIICHSSLLGQGQKANGGSTEITLVPMASRSAWGYKASEATLLATTLNPADERDLTALVMHTSGSTGTPKPIYHPHRIWTTAIPCMPGQPAFTTTPLFHGGSADLFRSMNALSTLYLFSSAYPMTVSNILGALSVCPDVRAFLSVPYILKMLAESSEGLKMLQTMDLVSTGGAPLPEALGNDMVRQGVKLVSRLGSSECGFLMSSHRDYENDKEWAWLRNNGFGLKFLRFVPVADSEEENMYELVVDKEWSTRVVSNRPDSSFATGDLYAKHLTMPDTWRYHGRTDDIVVLITGKKASANSLETALRACPAVSEAVVFGTERPALGAIILPASSSTSRQEILEQVHFVNDSSTPYARIPDQLVIILGASAAADIPKTSKGSVIRPKALQAFATLIEEAYKRLDSSSAEPEDNVDCRVDTSLSGEADVKTYIRDCVLKALRQRQHSQASADGPSDTSDGDDLFNAGIDSVQAVVVRSSLQKLIAESGNNLSSNVVFEHPSIARLTKHILDLRSGIVSTPASEVTEEGQHRLMRQLLQRYSFPVDAVSSPISEERYGDDPDEDGIVIITGVTGSLGVHIMMRYLTMTGLRVFALVRASDGSHALRRIVDNMKHRDDLDAFEELQHRVTALAANLSEERLGLREDVFQEMVEKTVAVIHVAWPVNFALNLESFEPALRGLRHLLDLTSRSQRGARLVFCSSTSAALNSVDEANVVYERLPESESAAAPVGYARSKWVAEHLCQNAHETVLAGRVAVARIGQLCGDTEDGIWNESEAWPLLIASLRYTGCLPTLANEKLSLLPFDIAARAIMLIANFSITSLPREFSANGDLPIAHVLNPNKLLWNDLLSCLSSSGLSFQKVAPTEWMSRLRALQAEDRLDPATARLLDLWQEEMVEKTVAVIHVAWPVNFALNLESFEPALRGLRNLLDLTSRSRRGARLVFCSSTSAALNSVDEANVVYERLPENESAAAPVGYARSKWVAEHLCQNAHETVLAGRVAVARIGQLCGDTEDGIWNESEAWPLLIASLRYTGCLPTLANEKLSLLPFDIAARAIMLIANFSITSLPREFSANGDLPIAHVLNPNKLLWNDLLSCLSSSGLSFQKVAPTEWMSRLRALQAEDRLDPATARLLDLWQEYVDHPNGNDEPVYDLSAAERVTTCTRDIAKIDWPVLVGRWVSSWRRSDFLPV
ncbi:uncharacterized protein PHACADRAFT_213424 [Phanerochaete carnosa HHB-10118-sp]|uniref:Carrier domain-containing protein n=1 Tax=Phanerochaete carnosa (strain HHB-10118-sp) TaxID=650164 RepID=K5VH03_PHACS|nr:uncharacterized protein PHACADRAFT_213424 [Phanerochaete carnosa HHB-10118-sp]EKM50503.1 hypothetical protein PHACADRAFT_213424 [Phanerochaete carnosa HHB-10118-sp]